MEAGIGREKGGVLRIKKSKKKKRKLFLAKVHATITMMIKSESWDRFESEGEREREI
jgi:hypothetical protein